MNDEYDLSTFSDFWDPLIASNLPRGCFKLHSKNSLNRSILESVIHTSCSIVIWSKQIVTKYGNHSHLELFIQQFITAHNIVEIISNGDYFIILPQ